MIEQLRFYISHSFNDLRTSKQLAFFALLSIAAGVAAIVSLQTLAVMIQDALTGNLQESNRGDIVLSVQSEFGADDAVFEQAVDDGVFTAHTLSFFGQEATIYSLGADGIDQLQAWIDEHYPGQIRINYRLSLSSAIEIFTGSGLGTSITAMETGNQAISLTAVVIDPASYPFYGQIMTLSGEVLADVLQSPTDIVIGDNIARDLELEVGDMVAINGSDATFIVRGVVDAGDEVRNLGSDIGAALFGFYYLNQSAVLSEDAVFTDIPFQTDGIYMQVDDPALVQQINGQLLVDFGTTDSTGAFVSYFNTTTVDDLREQNETLANNINQLVTVMGLVSMLIGSIGIINTMQVIVRRRTLEIAVLKTIGLQAGQITSLFLVEALLLGVIGSIVGIVLGWGTTFIIKGVAESLFGQALPFRIALTPVFNGFVIGILVTTIFGFLPTLTAGQVRPGIVLRPSDNVVPKAGVGRILIALAVIIIALSLVASTILGSFGLSLVIVSVAFVLIGILYAILWGLIWLVGNIFPTLGSVDLKISLRQMLAGRGRGASTLLALVIGVFSLSLITLFASSINNLLSSALEEGAGGNIIVSVATMNTLPTVEETIQNFEAVESYETLINYTVELVGMTLADGTELSREDINARVLAAPQTIPFGPPLTDAQRLQIFDAQLSTIDALEVDNLPDVHFIAGRQLDVDDIGMPQIVLTDNDSIDALGVQVGDNLIFQYISQNPLSGEQTDTAAFEVVGIAQQAAVNISFNNSSTYAFSESFPETWSPTGISVIVDVPEENVPEFRRAIGAIPGTFALETARFVRLFINLLGTFTAFPIMVAALGLVVGGVVIANSVALTTMERRREIAVMKAIGLQRERVLGMILLENGLLGFIGGLIGVGIGLLALFLLLTLSMGPADAIPYGTALLLMLLCIVVALVAAVTSAWGASGEKPLNVLRYE